MLILAITSRRRDATRRDQAFYIDAEREACVELQASGMLRGAFKRADGRGVVLVLEAATRAAVVAELDRLPTVETGAAGYRALVVETLNGFATPDFGNLSFDHQT